MLCKHHKHQPEDWICPACINVKPREDPSHTRDDGCRYGPGGREVYRRIKKQFGVRAKVGSVRDPAIPAVGEADVMLITDDLDLDADVGGAIRAFGALSAFGEEEVVREDEALGIMRGGVGVVAKEGRVVGDTHQNTNKLPDLVDLIEDEEDHDVFNDRLSPITVRERRIAKARQVFGVNKKLEERGNQADQAAAEDHRTTDVTSRKGQRPGR